MTAEPTDRAERYEPFFGLREPPFSLAPNARFRFASASHSAALAQVAAAIERREPLVVVTGEIGTGKTLLCRTMLQELPRKTFLSVVDDPMLGRDDLLTQLLQDFGVMSKDRIKITPTRHELVETLHAFLRSLAPIGAHAVVIVDEAQHLQPDVLEQIRLLSNVDDEHGTLLQMMLVGQANLEPLLSRPELRQLAQRVSRRVRLEPLNADEVRQYIDHRLAVARALPASAPPGAAELAKALSEWSGPEPTVEFTPEAVDAIARRSSGVPRIINLLCDRALAAAYHVRLRTIGAPLIDTASRSLGIGIEAGSQKVDAPASASAPPVASAQPLAPAQPPGLARPNESAQPAASVQPAASASSAPSAAPAPAAPPSNSMPSNSPLLPVAPVSATPALNDALMDMAAAPVVPPVPVVPASQPVPSSPGLDSLPSRSDGPVSPAVRVEKSSSRSKRYLGPAAAAIVAAAAIWIGLRVVRPAPAPATSAPRTARPPTTPSPAVQPSVTPPPTAPAAAATAAAQTPPSAAAGSTSKPGGGPAVGGHFDLVVASFRTESRAAAIGASVAALNLPVRQRVSDGWQQVIVGPFTSRAEAESARERLDRAGLTGSQIVPTEQ